MSAFAVGLQMLFRVCLTHLCRPVRSTFAVRETASLGIMGAPEIPSLCREMQSLGQQMLNAPVGINGLIDSSPSSFSIERIFFTFDQNFLLLFREQKAWRKLVFIKNDFIQQWEFFVSSNPLRYTTHRNWFIDLVKPNYISIVINFSRIFLVNTRIFFLGS